MIKDLLLMIQEQRQRGINNQLGYLISEFNDIHTYILQDLYPKLKVYLKPVGYAEKSELIQDIRQSRSIKDFSNAILQYMRKI